MGGLMRVLVCGGRNYRDQSTVDEALLPYATPDAVIVNGAAGGADTLAQRFAERFGVRSEQYPADWRKHGRAAGPIRNQQMLDSGVDIVIAFPGGRGTADMVGRARDAGVPVMEVDLGNA